MKIKTFYCKTMGEALQQIKNELGPEALLLSTKEVPSRSFTGRGSSGFEVVAAIDDTEAHDFTDFSSPSQRDVDGESVMARKLHAREPQDDSGMLTYSPALMKPVMPAAKAKKRSTPQASVVPHPIRTVDNPVGEPLPPFKGAIARGLHDALLARGVHDWLASKLIATALEEMAPKLKRSRASMLNAVAKATRQLFPVASAQNGLPGKRLVAFVGPTGVGKTTSMAKLAARLAMREHKRVALVTLDGYRIGAVEQMKTYATLMGIPFRFVNQISELAKTLSDHAHRDYILIDTAGRAPRDLAAMQELSDFLKNCPDMERHLVLSATTKPSDMNEVVDRFEVCRPDHLLFTKLDETSTPGPILNELMRTGKSFSYYSNGQRIPEDLHAVVGEQIIDIVLNAN